MFGKIQRLDRIPGLSPLGLKFLVLDDLKEAGKIDHAFFWNVKDIVFIEIPLDLEEPHHPWIGISLDLHAYDTPAPSGLDFSFQILKEIGFDILALLQGKI